MVTGSSAAWSQTLQRIRMAMRHDFSARSWKTVPAQKPKLTNGLSGKARNVHVSERKRRITGTGTKDTNKLSGLTTART